MCLSDWLTKVHGGQTAADKTKHPATPARSCLDRGVLQEVGRGRPYLEEEALATYSIIFSLDLAGKLDN